MSRSFRGFLLAYCQELANSQTASLKKLCHIMQDGCPRLAEPLLLLAVCDQRESYLLRNAGEGAVASSYRNFLDAFHSSNLSLEDYLQTLSDGNRYMRPLVAWKAEKARQTTDRRTLRNIARAICTLLDEKRLTRADACRITGLNKGNFYAFLKGDVNKLSRATAVRAYEQLESYQAVL